MTAFQSVLEKEMSETTRRMRLFSWKIFGTGIFLYIILVGIAVLISYIQKDRTIDAVKSKLSSKTVAIERTQSASNQIQTISMAPITADTAPRTPASPPKNEHQKTIDAASFYTKNNKGQLLPTISAEGMSPFNAFKQPPSPSLGKPLLSFVIYNIGLSQQQTNNIIEELPHTVTVAFSPYTKNLQAVAKMAFDHHHEVWLTLPLETKNYPIDDPGPYTLMKNTGINKNTTRLHDTLSSAQYYAGVVTQKDHAYTKLDAESAPYIKEIFDRGLSMLDTNPTNFAKLLAERNNDSYAATHIWLDDIITPLSLNQKIREISNRADINENTIIMLHPYPASIEALLKFLNSSIANKFDIVPVSAQMSAEK